jgi:hypothetical protein
VGFFARDGVIVLAVASITKGVIWVLAALYGDDVPEQLRVAERFTLWFFVIAFLLFAAMDIAELVVDEARSAAERHKALAGRSTASAGVEQVGDSGDLWSD